MRVSSGKEVVSDAMKLLNTGVSDGDTVLMEEEGVNTKVISLLVIERSSLVGVGVGVRVSSGKDVVSDTMKLLSTGVSDGELMEEEGVTTRVVSDRMTTSLLEIENTSLGVGVGVSTGKEVVSDTVRLLGTGVSCVSDGMPVSVMKNSLVGVGVGVGVNSNNVVVSDRTKLLNT